MTFNSLSFVLFFSIFLTLYYLLPKKLQNPLLLLGNYVFYSFGGVTAVLLLLAGTVITYGCGRAIEASFCRVRRLWLVIGEVYMLGLLFALKYLGFFSSLLSALTGAQPLDLTGVLLPIGISFYTFSVSAYLFDVYRGKLAAERNILSYAIFVSFFPAILSGPVGKAREFLPQLQSSRRFQLLPLKEGLLRFVIGCVKKMALADRLGILVNTAYADTSAISGSLWILVAIAYSFQIYLDFSAYSDMALGVAKMLGFQLTENFRYPYNSRTVKEFWKKWHISLTSWFREYLYFPLGGSHVPTWRCYMNILIVFAVSGLWHGAAMQFIVWGLLNGIYQVAGELTSPLRKKAMGSHSRLVALWQTLCTFALIAVSWVFFRATSVSEALFILKRILLFYRTDLGTSSLLALGANTRDLIFLAVLLLGYFIPGFINKAGALQKKLPSTTVAYWLTIGVLLLILSLFGVYGVGFDPQDFVYFSF